MWTQLYMPLWGLYGAYVTSIGPEQAQYWHIVSQSYKKITGDLVSNMFLYI